MYDLKIKGGLIVDGTGRPGFAGDVGIVDGRVVALGDAPAPARREIDAKGKVVAPGFVDPHTHYDAQVLWDPMITISPWYGATTVVMGNCGFGVAPTRPEHRGLILRTLERVEGMDLTSLETGIGPDWPFETYGEYLDALEARGPAVNLVSMVGHTPVRMYVMGDDATTRAATPDEIGKMKSIVADAVRDGAIGFATSVSQAHIGYSGRPVPSRLAQFDEMIAMAEAVRDARGSVVHFNLNGEPDFDQFNVLAEASRTTVCWQSFLAGTPTPEKRRLHREEALRLRELGLPVVRQIPCRPLAAEFNFNEPITFDTWALFEPVRRASSAAERLRIYSDPAFRQAFRDEVEGRGGRDAAFAGGAAEGAGHRENWRHIEISYSPDDPSLEERKASDIAKARGVHPVDVVLDLAVATKLKARFRMPLGYYDDEDVTALLKDRHNLIGLGDGGAHMSQQNDACYTAHLLARWVREEKVLSLEQGVQMLTQHPARVFGIRDRGELRVGMPADVVIFDAETIKPGPLQRVNDLPGGSERMISYPVGIEAVIVNGSLLPAPGEPLLGKPAGRVLRHGLA